MLHGELAQDSTQALLAGSAGLVDGKRKPLVAEEVDLGEVRIRAAVGGDAQAAGVQPARQCLQKLPWHFAGVVQADAAMGDAILVEPLHVLGDHRLHQVVLGRQIHAAVNVAIGSLEGRDTIPTGWSKKLPSFNTPDVPITSFYKFEREQWGDQVMRYYRFTNSIASKLGKEPLPDGQVKAFRLATEDNLYAFVGRTSIKYIPINETVEMELGNDQEVLVKPTLMKWEKTNLQFDQNGNVKGWTIQETWQVEVQNSKDIPVRMDLRRNFAGDWSIKTDTQYEKVDANKVKFLLPLKAHEKRPFSYDVTIKFGTSATR